MEKELLKKLRRDKWLEFGEYKYLLEKAHSLLSESNESSYNRGLEIICYIADTKPSDPFIKQLLYDCIVESRIFLYEGMLARFQDDYFKDSRAAFSIFSKSIYTLDSGTILTKDQKTFLMNFKKRRDWL